MPAIVNGQSFLTLSDFKSQNIRCNQISLVSFTKFYQS